MNSEARLEKIFKQLKLLRFSVKRGHRLGEWFWQFGNSVDIIMTVCRIVVVCQMLKAQQNLVCFDRRRGFPTTKLRLTGRATLFLLSRRCTRGAVCDLLVNCCRPVKAIEDLFCSSCHHFVAFFWSRVLNHLAVEETRFRMRIILGVVLIRSLACTQCVPGRLRSGSGVAL